MLKFESKFSTSIGTLKFKVIDPGVSPEFLYYWVEHLYNSGRIPKPVSVSSLKAAPFYNKTLADVATISPSLEDFDFEINRIGGEAGKPVNKTASHVVLAAASQAKKEALAKKYGFSIEEIERLADADPTPNGTYTEWLTREYKRGMPLGLTLDTVINQVEGKLEVFEKLKNSPQWRLVNKSDINTYNLAGFIDVINAATRADLSKKERERDLEKHKDKYALAGSELLGDVGQFRVYRVTTVEASMILSKDTHWCTQGEAHAANYLKKAPLYVVTTPGELNEDYASDKYCQIFVPQDPNRIECQDINGDELGENKTDGYVVERSDFWPLFEFIAQHDKLVADYIQKNIICASETDYWDTRRECDSCSKIRNSEDFIEVNGESYCSEQCFKDGYETTIKQQVDELMEPFEDQLNEDSIKAQEEFQEIVQSPDCPIKDYIDVMKTAIQRHNERQGNQQMQDESILSLDWHVGNLASTLRVSEDSRRKIFPDTPLETFQEAQNFIMPFYDRSKENFELVRSEAEQYVVENFDSTNMDVKTILVDGGWINPEGEFIKKSAWTNSLLSKASASEESYDYAILEAVYSDAVVQGLLEFVNEEIGPEDVYSSGEAKGLEDTPHITLLYGIKQHEPDSEKISEIIKQSPLRQVKWDGLDKFESGVYDVLVIKVSSNDAESLFHKFDELYPDNANSFPNYKAHTTLAYVKKGQSDKYIQKYSSAFIDSSVSIKAVRFDFNGASVDYNPRNGEVQG